MPLWRVQTFLLPQRQALEAPPGFQLLCGVWGTVPRKKGSGEGQGLLLGVSHSLRAACSSVLKPAAVAAPPSDPAAPDDGRACGGQSHRHSRRGAHPGMVFLSSEVLDGGYTHTYNADHFNHVIFFRNVLFFWASISHLWDLGFPTRD